MTSHDADRDSVRLTRLRADAMDHLERMTSAMGALVDQLEAGDKVSPPLLAKTVAEFGYAHRLVLEQRKHLDRHLGDESGAGRKIAVHAAKAEIERRLADLRRARSSG